VFVPDHHPVRRVEAVDHHREFLHDAPEAFHELPGFVPQLHGLGYVGE
jgi:hypothetical protein